MRKTIKKNQLLKLVICFIFIGLIYMLSIFLSRKLSPPAPTLTQYAEKIFETCKEFKGKDKCYSDKIFKLTKDPVNLTMEEAFQILENVREKDPTFAYCHTLAHDLGSAEVTKNPANWKDVAARCPSNLCSGGCSHGAFIEKFKTETIAEGQADSLKSELATICEPREDWHPKEVDVYNCNHGLGHLSMFLTNANISKSVEICEDIGKETEGREYIENCISGVFMQLFQPLEPDDFTLIENIAPQKNKQSIDKFCDSFTGIPYYVCHRESWPYFWNDISTPEGLTNFCSYTSDFPQQTKCYKTLMNAVANHFAFKKNNLPFLADFCTKLPTNFQSLCFLQTTSRILQTSINLTDKAIFMCREAAKTSPENGKKCDEFLINYPNKVFNKGSEEYKNYCSRLPENLKVECQSNS